MSDVVDVPVESQESETSAAPAPTRMERALSVLAKTDETAPAPNAEEAPKPPPTSPDLSAHAKALALAQKKEREAFEANKRAQTLEQELAAERAKLEGRKKLTPLEALKQDYGLDYAGLTKAIVEQKWATPTPEQEALSAHDQELKALKEKIDAYEAEKAQTKAEQIRSANLDYLKSEIQARSQDYALVAALPGDHIGQIYAQLERLHADGQEPDVHAVIAQYESAAKADVDALFASDLVLQKFLADPAIKTRVVNLLGLNTKQSPQPDQQALRSQRTPLPHTHAQDPGARSVPVRDASPKSRIDRALEAVAAKRGQ